MRRGRHSKSWLRHLNKSMSAVSGNGASRGHGIYEHLVGSVKSLVSSLVVALFIITFLMQAFQIPSASMERTLLVGDYLLVDKTVYGAGGSVPLLPYREVGRGDIVVFHYPLNPDTYFVKRVVAVPGDRVRMLDKQLYVNGRLEQAGYAWHRDAVHDAYRDDFPNLTYAPGNVDRDWFFRMRREVGVERELVVPAGQYFVLGDNRDNSQDSRYWGFVPRANIIGQPLLIYWSVRSERGTTGVPAARGDTLSGLAYAVTHLHQDARWERMLRIVR